jgi:hypothetical protein
MLINDKRFEDAEKIAYKLKEKLDSMVIGY